ncbi:agmatine deiminase [Vibrio gazogenes]|uniref:Putative agmatine deiminase n=1 Tax=Vibrio gazogenes DSM 21264 = NBRC 103151 TaxID=1123492 RepID=A0A1M4TWY3_VIBGA|nr:agmatine deiminase [Vibrio gazogenes]USP16179.1 agmatine deiminase [Vibrio gazogenes]SHE48932.1 agmatine deiminase [Vibrio gazogenes DSM 21264] [Vibrio gazogenes DSM 21264 = NBRC 103151]SJN53065.1 Agmatine deiminase [Vibrio gazogenes]
MSRTLTSRPLIDGYRMPGEHEAHREVWLAWPARGDNWRYSGKPAQKAFVDVAVAIAQHTPVVMLVEHSQFDNARSQLPADISVVEMSYNDCWMRDIGATYVVDAQGKRRGINWQFNAWGGLVDGLYFPWDLDNAVATKMLNLTQDDIYDAPFILEGGSIHTDGDGTVYTTEECLLHPSRNPDLSKQDIEQQLKLFLGAEKVIWLPRGLYNDETNGHVDNILHVVKPGEVMLTWCEDKEDPQYAISREALDVLCTERDAKGRTIKVHQLPLPGPLYMTEEEAAGIDHSQGMVRQSGERLAASYANFLISNGQVIFPLLDKSTDEIARSVIQAAFPDHQITGIDAREILLGGGNIHCITQQVPA